MKDMKEAGCRHQMSCLNGELQDILSRESTSQIGGRRPSVSSTIYLKYVQGVYTCVSFFQIMHTVWYVQEGCYNFFICKGISTPWIQIDLLSRTNLLIHSPGEQVNCTSSLMGRADFSMPDICCLSYRLQSSERKLKNEVWAL